MSAPHEPENHDVIDAQVEPGEDDTVSTEPEDTSGQPSEPAPPPATPSGPGWAAYGLIFMAVLAAIALGILNFIPGFSLSGESDPATKGDIAALESRVDTLQDTVSGLESGTRQASERADLMGERIDAVETAQSETRASAQSAAGAEEVSALSERLDAIETRIGSLSDGAASSGAMSGLEQRVAALEQTEDQSGDMSAAREEFAAIEQRITDISAQVETLEGELGEATERARREAASSDALLALSAVESAADEGRPFESAFATLKAALPDSQAVARLAPISRSGAPTLETLESEFDALREDVLDLSSSTGGTGLGWADAILGDGVKVRRTDEPDTKAADREVLQQAEEALASGQINVALDRLEGLKPQGREIFGEWIDAARKRLVLDNTLASLRRETFGGQ